MYARQITSEETFALSEARKAINTENEYERENFLTKTTQKLLGITALGVSVAEFIAGHIGMIDEGGLSFIMLPVGIYFLFTRKIIL